MVDIEEKTYQYIFVIGFKKGIKTENIKVKVFSYMFLPFQFLSDLSENTVV